MRLRCPHCHDPLELADEDVAHSVTCPSCGNSFNMVAGVSTAPWTRRRIAHFELLERVGVGHFGAVWKARDTTLDRLVAIKLPRKEDLSPEESAQFLREARAAAQLRHSRIVGVHEVGRENETIYIVSDFVEGATLQAWMAHQRLPPRESAQLIAQVADAVHHAHEQGVIHRDLKPGNIMLDLAGDPRVMDFGLARRESGEITMTMDGRLVGTPAYMSPEQARGKGHEADRRSDVYSLGVILYELLTGVLPFRGDTRMLIVQILQDDPPSPRKFYGRIPRDLETICLKCLQKSSARRYQSAAELRDDLQRWLDGKPIQARPVGVLGRTVRWCRRRPAVAGLLATIAAITLAGFAGITWQWREAIGARDAARKNLEASERHRQRRDVNYERALTAVDQMLKRVGEERLSSIPALTPIRKAILEDALAMYEEFLKDAPHDPATRFEVARAHMRVGAISALLSDNERVAKEYTAAASHLKDLRNTSSNKHTLGKHLSTCYWECAKASTAMKDFTGALSAYDQAITEFDALAKHYPESQGYTITLARCYGEKGEVEQRLGESQRALASTGRAIDRLEAAFKSQKSHGIFLAWHCFHGSRVAKAAGNDDVAAARLRRAIAVHKECLEIYGAFYQYVNSQIRQAPELNHRQSRHKDLADWTSKLADWLRESDPTSATQYDQAADEYEEATLKSVKGLIAKDPVYRELYALTCEKRALRQENEEKPAEAEALLAEAADELTKLLIDFPDRTPAKVHAARVATKQATLLSGSLDRSQDSLPYWKHAVELCEQVIALDESGGAAIHIEAYRGWSVSSAKTGDLATAEMLAVKAMDLALIYLRQAIDIKQRDQGIDVNKQAVACLSSFITSHGGNLQKSDVARVFDKYWEALVPLATHETVEGPAVAWAFYSEALKLNELNCEMQAVQVIQQAIAINDRVLARTSNDQTLQNHVTMLGLLANWYNYRMNRKAEAEALYLNMLATIEKLLAANPSKTRLRQQFVWLHYNSSAAISPERAEEAFAMLETAVTTLDAYDGLEFTPEQRSAFRVRMAAKAAELPSLAPERLERAAAQAARATAETPESAAAWRCRGNVELAMENWTSSLQSHERAVQLDSDPEGWSHLEMAVCHAKLSAREKSRQCLMAAEHRREGKPLGQRWKQLHKQATDAVQSPQ